MATYVKKNGKLVKEETVKKDKKKKKGTYVMRNGKLVLEGSSSSDDIAPVKTSTKPKRNVGGGSFEEKKRTWFTAGAFDDGYQFGDVTKTILGTATDLQSNATGGLLEIGEKVADAGAYGVGVAGKIFGNDKLADSAKEFIAKDLYSGEKIAAHTVGLAGNMVLKLLGEDYDDVSLYGEKVDSLAQSSGQLAGTYLAKRAGVPWFLTTGATSFGSSIEEAFKEDASYTEAGIYGAISTGAELLSEKLFGGSGLGETGLFKVDKLTKGIAKKAVKALVDLGIDMGTEGAEEIVSSFFSRLGSALTFEKEETWKKILTDEKAMENYISQVGNKLFGKEAWEEYGESFIGGMALGGFMNASQGIHSVKNKTDYRTGITANEQKVFDAEYKNRIAEKEKDGKKLSKNEKAKIYDEVLEDIKEGSISTDRIAEVLGGETYKAYQEAIEKDNQAISEIESIYEGEGLIQAKEDILKNSERNKLKAKMNEEVFNSVKNSNDQYLMESYNEVARRRQALSVDLNQYEGEQKRMLKDLMDKELVNNARYSKDFWTYATKAAADKGVNVTATTTEEILEMVTKRKGKEWVEKHLKGVTPNAYIMPDGTLAINVKSKASRYTLLGHEIGHTMENEIADSKFKEFLFAYAEAKEGKEAFANRRAIVESLYADGVGDAEVELTNDLIGEYIYSDTEFIRRLSVENKNIFQKIWDEIKYLCKVAMAGSQEQKDLLRLEKEFEKIYRESGKVKTEAKTDTNGEVKHSLSSSETDKAYFDAVKRGDTATAQKMVDEAAKNAGYNSPKLYHGTHSFGFTQIKTDGVEANVEWSPFFATNNIYTALTYSGVQTETEIGKSKRPEKSIASLRAEAEALLSNPKNASTGLVEAEHRDFYIEKYGNIMDDETIRLIKDGVEGAYAINNSRTEFKLVPYEEGFSVEDYENKRGNYGLYANTDGFLTVDGNGSEWNKLRSEYGSTTRIIAKNALNAGYNGVVIRDVYDIGFDWNGSVDEDADTISDVYIFFKPQSQVKSADPITYDDSGNVIPLSQRFNAEKDDIRFSLSDMDGNPIESDRISSDELDTKYSLSHNADIEKGQMDFVADKSKKSYVSSDELEDAQEVTRAMVDVMMKYSSILPEDKIGKVLTKNGSYDRSVENTTICVRTLAYNEFVDKVQEEIGRPLTQMESFLVSQKLYDIATEPQCLYCYVSLDRKAFNDMLLRYMQDRDTVIAKYNNSDKSQAAIDKLYEEFLHGRKDTKNMKERFNKWIGYVDNGTQLLSLADIATEDSQSVINANGGILAEQLKDARAYAQSASWSKIQKNYVAYRDEILKLGDRVVKNLNEHYGMRWYSFSDYSAAFIVENMQQITDASIRGLKGLAYTKDTDFAEIFAPSGMNVNISVFVNQDADGNFFIDEKQSANFEKALELRERYPNVGIVATVTNDEALRWVGQQAWSDVIIPFHIVRTGTDVAEYYKWLNYTSESADTVNNKDLWEAYLDSLNLKNENARKKVSKNIYPSEHKNNKDTYLNLCESRGLAPRFARFVGEDWYMKLVNETRLSSDESSPLKPNYNLEAAKASFQKFVDKGGYEGGWYKEGVDVDAEAKVVADDVIAGKKANEVDYGRQDGFVPEAIIGNRKNVRSHGFSLSYENAPKAKDAMSDAALIKDDELIKGEADDFAPIREDIPQRNIYTENVSTVPKAEDDIAPVFQQAEPVGRSTIAEREEPSAEENGGTLGRTEEVKPTSRKELHRGILDRIKAKFAEKGFDFDKVLKKAKNLSTFKTVDNTPQRVMEKSLGYKEGQILSDLTVNQVAQNETEGIKWLNSFTDRKKGLLAQISKQYGIKPGSKESAAAQMFAEGFYVDENNQLVEYGYAELAQDFPDESVRDNIIGLAKDERIRQIYDETLAKINESRARNLYPEIPRLENYFLHFRAMEDTFSRLGLPFNPNDIKAKDLPTDLNGVTADLKPGQPYFASAKHREGKRTSFDLLGGLERYLSSAKNQIYHIDDIQTLRALRNYIADTYGQANGLEGLDSLSEEEAQERIEQVYGSHLSTFAKFLNEEANILAGKTSLIDRGIEGVIGRRGITFLDTVNKQVGANMVGFNVSSSLTNFLAWVQAIAKTSKLACLKSLAQTTKSQIGSIFGETDSFVENNPTIIRRKGIERFYRTPYQKVGDAGYVLMSAVDNVTTEFIVRAKYNEFIGKGMSEQQAMIEADKWTSRLMGDRSLGQMPQLYNSKMLGLVTKFQLEVRNQLDSQFYDTIQEAKASNEQIENGLTRNAKTAAKVTSSLFQLAVLQHLFGKAFESVAGYNPAFDIISVLVTALGFDDDEESEDTPLDNIEQGFLELLEDLPYTSTFTGGRIPISSALPIEELIKGVDEYGNEKSRWETVKEIAPYYLLPGGYGQIKKTKQGLSMFNTDEDHPIAGSYTDSGDLRFPVEDTPWNRLQAALFGQYASKNAREYFDNGYAPLEEKQIQEFMDVGIPIGDYWKYREGLKGLKTAEEKTEYINSLDLNDLQKNLLINNLIYREYGIDMSDYDSYGSFEEFDYAQKNPEKYTFFKKNGISFKDYDSADEDTKDAYDWAYEYPKKYTLSKAVTSDVAEYRRYKSELDEIRADKDSNGKTINGSSKKKKAEYIFNLPLDYGQQIILYRSIFDSQEDKNKFNRDIVHYLNSRNDITYSEMETILLELDFKVSADGSISW